MRIGYVFFSVFIILLFPVVLQVGCNLDSGGIGLNFAHNTNTEGAVLHTRYAVSEGFERMPYDQNSFGTYLRNLPLKPCGTQVKFYDGSIKTKDNVYDAVVDLEIGNNNLQQCADAVMRLRAEYLFTQKRYADIHFNFTNGFRADYEKWRKGWRIRVKGNNVIWVKLANEDNSYKTFRAYLDIVFTYAGTLSLAKELKPASIAHMQCGDVFIQGGSPGHAVLVTDMMKSKKSGEKYFMLLQSYMPAQDIQVLLNPKGKAPTVWYLLDTTQEKIYTPEWTFTKYDLKKFE